MKTTGVDNFVPPLIRRRRWRFAQVAMAALTVNFLLTACSSQEPSPDDQSFLPRDQTPGPAPTGGIDFQVETNGVTITWLSEGNSLAITTTGSSSCPLAPLEFRGAEQEVLVLAIDSGGSELCTADMSPTTSIVERPTKWNIPGPIEYEAVGEEYLLTLTDG